MPELLTDPVAPQNPLVREGQLDTDTFCESCGYNLHGQRVARDERLGIMICQCPECGRYHPAGHRTTAQSVWLSRMAAAGLMFWILVVLTVVFLLGMGLGAIDWLHVDAFSSSKTVAAANGREIGYAQVNGAWTTVYAGTMQPVLGNVRQVRTVKLPGDLSLKDRWMIMIILHFFAAGLGMLSGILLVVVLWHWPRRKYFWFLLLPLLAALWDIGFVLVGDDQYELIRGWAISRVLYQMTIQMIFVIIGIRIGRPVARWIIRMIIPPRPRQHLNFLWRIDGKIPPPATIPAA
jgi:hypothetical protein